MFKYSFHKCFNCQLLITCRISQQESARKNLILLQERLIKTVDVILKLFWVMQVQEIKPSKQIHHKMYYPFVLYAEEYL